MTDTYRMSRKIARNQLLVSSVLTLLILAYCTVTTLHTDGNDSITIAVVVTVAIFGGIFYWRIYKRAVDFERNHTLALESDAVVIRDGATESHVAWLSGDSRCYLLPSRECGHVPISFMDRVP